MLEFNAALANNLLIAMPKLNELSFNKTVIYICEHHQQGTVGLIINKPMQHNLGFILAQLRIEAKCIKNQQLPLLFGGPVQPERGFVIHRPTGSWRSSISLRTGVTVTTSNDIIMAIADNRGPNNALLILGYVGWEAHQLEQEILDNAWLICPYIPELLYEVPFEQRWEYAGLAMGVKMNQINSGSGHA